MRKRLIGKAFAIAMSGAMVLTATPVTANIFNVAHIVKAADEQSDEYEKQYNGRYVLLRKACERSGHKNSTEYKAFLEKNEAWVYDYCLYMAVKNHFGGINWTE